MQGLRACVRACVQLGWGGRGGAAPLGPQLLMDPRSYRMIIRVFGSLNDHQGFGSWAGEDEEEPLFWPRAAAAAAVANYRCATGTSGKGARGEEAEGRREGGRGRERERERERGREGGREGDREEGRERGER